MSKKEPCTIYSGIPTEVVANAEPLDYGNKSQLKALAIQHFKSTYKVTWYEYGDKCIKINDMSEEYNCEEPEELALIYVDCSKDHIINIGKDIECPLEMLEDLISILRLYYIGDK